MNQSLLLISALLALPTLHCFLPSYPLHLRPPSHTLLLPPPTPLHHPTFLKAGSARLNNNDNSKRQNRVSQLVRSELASLIFGGSSIKSPKTSSPIAGALRQSINIIAADVSPDLRNCRVTVSIMSTTGVTAASKREAFAWLTVNTSAIKHSLAQRLKYMKRVPNLLFVLTDVGKAVDLMHLIDSISRGDDKVDTIVTSPIGEDDEGYYDGWEDGDELEDGDEDSEDDGDEDTAESIQQVEAAEDDEDFLTEEDEKRLADLLKF